MSIFSTKVSWALLAASIIGIALFIIGMVRNDSFGYWFLAYNLVLALIPLLLAVWLRWLLRYHAWTQWRIVVVLCVWLLFLPNSFYIVTDFVHLYETQRVDVAQDIVMLMQFSILGLVFGFMSLSILHVAFMKYLARRIVILGIGTVLFLSSFAIYIGRELRWNSWDVFMHPIALFRDVAVAANPFIRPEAAWMTLSFFMMLASLYAVWWYGLERVKR